MNDFNLRRLVRSVLATSTMTDPHALAAEVLRRIGKDNYRAALQQCLADAVREEIRHSRNGGFPTPPAPMTPPAGPRLTLHKGPDAPEAMAEHAGGRPASVSKPQSVAKSGRSAKVAGIRDMGHRWMRDRLNTGGEPREWKRVGDCTFADLMFAAGQRREQAARTSAVAGRLEALAELLRVHKVERVRDLPESVLAVVGGAAA